MSVRGAVKTDVAEAVEAMLLELDGRSTGLSALTVNDILVEKGFSLYSAQRAIQRALDAGTVRLGQKLELQANRNVLAVE